MRSGAAAVCGGHRNQAALFGDYRPASGGLAVEGEIDARKGNARVFGLHEQHLADQQSFELLVRVAEDDGVQLRDLFGKLVHHVFGRFFGGAGPGIATQPGVRCDYDHVGPLVVFQFGHGLAHRIDRSDEAVGAEIFGSLPDGDDGCGDADDGHLDAADGFHDIGRELAFEGAAAGERGIGGEPGKFCVGARLRQVGESGVVFVIAHGHGVVSQQVHGAHHGIACQRRGRFVTHRIGAASRNGLVYAFERRALYGVAAIDQ